MIVKYLAAIISFFLGILPLLTEHSLFLKNLSQKKFYKHTIYGLISLCAVVIIVSIYNDHEKEKSDEKEKNEQKRNHEKEIGRLNNDLDTIKQSLPQYGLALSNGKVIQAPNYYNIVRSTYASIQNNIGNTYNNTKIDNSQNPIIPMNSEKATEQNPEIIITKLPSLNRRKEGDLEDIIVTYSVKTKREEANYATDLFKWACKKNGIFYYENQYQPNHYHNNGIITCHPIDLTYDITPRENLNMDTCYFLLEITYKNSTQQIQKPLRVLSRVSKGSTKAVIITSGQEYADVMGYISGISNP